MNETRSVVRVALTRFILLSFGTLVVIGAGAAVVSENIAQDEAVRDAETRTERMASGIAAPLVNAGVRRQEAGDLRILDHALRTRVDDGTVAHIVVWDETGRILWADDADQIGAQAPLPASVRALAASTR